MPKQKKVVQTIYLGSDRCVFCGSDEDNEAMFGQKLVKNGLFVHYFCMLFASGLCQNGKSDSSGILGFLPDDIISEVRRAKRLRCVYCSAGGASIGCLGKQCRKSYHFGCGLKNGVLFQFFDCYQSFCQVHRPQQSLKVWKLSPKKHNDSVCCVCMCHVTHTLDNDTLKGPCCRDSWFHRECMQNYATSSGLYYFKCPLCNNKEDFQREMLLFGIYIPDQDASWEREHNAFSELYERHCRCDVPKCLCPKGRSYDKDDSKWEIILCQMCGAHGGHVGCVTLPRSGVLLCPDCQTISERVKTTCPAKSKTKVKTKNKAHGTAKMKMKITKELPPKYRTNRLLKLSSVLSVSLSPLKLENYRLSANGKTSANNSEDPNKVFSPRKYRRKLWAHGNVVKKKSLPNATIDRFFKVDRSKGRQARFAIVKKLGPLSKRREKTKISLNSAPAKSRQAKLTSWVMSSDSDDLPLSLLLNSSPQKQYKVQKLPQFPSQSCDQLVSVSSQSPLKLHTSPSKSTTLSSALSESGSSSSQSSGPALPKLYPAISGGDQAKPKCLRSTSRPEDLIAFHAEIRNLIVSHGASSSPIATNKAPPLCFTQQQHSHITPAKCQVLEGRKRRRSSSQEREITFKTTPQQKVLRSNSHPDDLVAFHAEQSNVVISQTPTKTCQQEPSQRPIVSPVAKVLPSLPPASDVTIRPSPSKVGSVSLSENTVNMTPNILRSSGSDDLIAFHPDFDNVIISQSSKKQFPLTNVSSNLVDVQVDGQSVLQNWSHDPVPLGNQSRDLDSTPKQVTRTPNKFDSTLKSMSPQSLVKGSAQKKLLRSNSKSDDLVAFHADLPRFVVSQKSTLSQTFRSRLLDIHALPMKYNRAKLCKFSRFQLNRSHSLPPSIQKMKPESKGSQSGKSNQSQNKKRSSTSRRLSLGSDVKSVVPIKGPTLRVRGLSKEKQVSDQCAVSEPPNAGAESSVCSSKRPISVVKPFDNSLFTSISGFDSTGFLENNPDSSQEFVPLDSLAPMDTGQSDNTWRKESAPNCTMLTPGLFNSGVPGKRKYSEFQGLTQPAPLPSCSMEESLLSLTKVFSKSEETVTEAGSLKLDTASEFIDLEEFMQLDHSASPSPPSLTPLSSRSSNTPDVTTDRPPLCTPPSLSPCCTQVVPSMSSVHSHVISPCVENITSVIMASDNVQQIVDLPVKSSLPGCSVHTAGPALNMEDLKKKVP